MSYHLKQFHFISRYDILIFFLFFLAVTLLNRPYLHIPPVWDTAAGVFAPAIYLYENNFDFSGLVQQPGYLDGGPNVHSLSPITFLTYAAISLTDGDPDLYLPALHLLNFFFAAVVLTATFILARWLLGSSVALMLTSALLIFPLFLVQTGYLYTEVVGAALVLLAIMSWASRRMCWMLLFAVAACLVKSIGIVLIFSMIAVVLLDTEISLQRRFFWCGLLTGLALAIEVARRYVAVSLTLERISYLKSLLSLVNYLTKVPDLCFLVILSCLFPVFFFIRHKAFTPARMHQEISRLVKGDISTRAWVSICIFPIFLIGFFAMVPLSGKTFYSLPRYYVWGLPLMLMTFGCSAVELYSLLPASWKVSSFVGKKHLGILVLALTAILFGVNRHGKFYPYSGTPIRAFSVVERSFEYVDFFKIQLGGVQDVVKHHDGRPVFVTRGESYFLSSPLMGYVDERVPNANFVLNEPYSSGELNVFPSDFLLLDAHSNDFHGQHIVNRLLKQAGDRDGYKVELLSQHASGPYRSALFRIYVKNNFMD